jgi:hypothetical protein
VRRPDGDGAPDVLPEPVRLRRRPRVNEGPGLVDDQGHEDREDDQKNEDGAEPGPDNPADPGATLDPGAGCVGHPMSIARRRGSVNVGFVLLVGMGLPPASARRALAFTTRGCTRAAGPQPTRSRRRATRASRPEITSSSRSARPPAVRLGRGFAASRRARLRERARPYSLVVPPTLKMQVPSLAHSVWGGLAQAPEQLWQTQELPEQSWTQQWQRPSLAQRALALPPQLRPPKPAQSASVPHVPPDVDPLELPLPLPPPCCAGSIVVRKAMSCP